MNQRQRFIEEWLHDEWSFSALCQAFDISRKTGYKWLERFKAGGIDDLADQPRACQTHPNATPTSIEARIVQFRHQHPFWGPRKLKKRLGILHPDQIWPASSTIGSILKQHGLARPILKVAAIRRSGFAEGHRKCTVKIRKPAGETGGFAPSSCAWA